jgi:Fe2+ or Zn2+ uptake regulation protein
MQTIESALAEALRARGGRVTPQRLTIARVLQESEGHVTAEGLFGQVSARLPGVSLPTVYATLELLEDLGHVRRVPASTGAIVFDSRTEEHDHFICRRCGAVTDLESHIERDRSLAAASVLGAQADEAQVLVSGICADCLARGAETVAH